MVRILIVVWYCTVLVWINRSFSFTWPLNLRCIIIVPAKTSFLPGCCWAFFSFSPLIFFLLNHVPSKKFPFKFMRRMRNQNDNFCTIQGRSVILVVVVVVLLVFLRFPIIISTVYFFSCSCWRTQPCFFFFDAVFLRFTDKAKEEIRLRTATATRCCLPLLLFCSTLLFLVP